MPISNIAIHDKEKTIRNFESVKLINEVCLPYPIEGLSYVKKYSYSSVFRYSEGLPLKICGSRVCSHKATKRQIHRKHLPQFELLRCGCRRPAPAPPPPAAEPYCAHVTAMLNIFITKMIHKKKSKHILAEAALHFNRSIEDLDQEIREHLGLSPEVPYVTVVIVSPHSRYFSLQIEEFGPTILHPSLMRVGSCSRPFTPT
ncbi:hypothetical protein EVAR_23174_1 [Eumeta japonica]|uniref:Uncharacterized protein n=1 Tax=Eumeta variegata TaxID=151549 RepID=A0A4C2ACF0_EUMVA|nr:hypothetical protein EVAR_23174_1 [Eumeta japonica]